MLAQQQHPLPEVATRVAPISAGRRLVGVALAGVSAASLVSVAGNASLQGLSYARWIELAQMLVAGGLSAVSLNVHSTDPAMGPLAPGTPFSRWAPQTLAALGAGFFASAVLPGILSVQNGDGLAPASMALATCGLAMVGVAAGVTVLFGNRLPQAPAPRALRAVPPMAAMHMPAGPA